ncbi:MAG: hypothetical protein WDO19_05980 [Bacteroidota bacterium]
MKKNNIIRVNVNVEKNSPLDHVLEEYLKKRTEKRKKLKEVLSGKGRKTTKKTERCGL